MSLNIDPKETCAKTWRIAATQATHYNNYFHLQVDRLHNYNKIRHYIRLMGYQVQPCIWIYTIILCLSVLANCRLQCLLGRIGRCLKLFASTDSTSCCEFASQFGLEIVLYAKNTQNYREYRVVHATVYLNEAPTGHSTPEKRGR